MGYLDELRTLIGSRPVIMPGANVILINDEGEILMHHRTDRDIWGLPGGMMELGEAFEDTARREVAEEVNLTLGQLDLFKVYSGDAFYYKYPDGNEVYNITATFLCRDYQGIVQVEKSEGRDARFFRVEDLPHNLSPTIKPILEDYLNHVRIHL